MQVRKEGEYRSISKTALAIIRVSHTFVVVVVVIIIGLPLKLLQERGIAGMLDGVSLRLSRKALGSMIAWGMYESVLLFFLQSTINKGA